MWEIRTFGLMSGDGKRSVAAWPKPPRPSSTLRWIGVWLTLWRFSARGFSLDRSVGVRVEQPKFKIVCHSHVPAAGRAFVMRYRLVITALLCMRVAAMRA